MARRLMRASGFSGVRIALFAVAVAILMAAGTAPARLSASDAARSRALLLFAAASLTDALDEIGDAFKRQTGIEVRASYAASSVLARQIEAGAPADVFFPADHDWM